MTTTTEAEHATYCTVVDGRCTWDIRAAECVESWALDIARECLPSNAPDCVIDGCAHIAMKARKGQLGRMVGW